MEAVGRAINDTEVKSIGEVRLQFWVDGHPMWARCKVTKGLFDDVVLGWDWMARLGTSLDAEKGCLKFTYPVRFTTPLIENAAAMACGHYRVTEDVALPANSKLHLKVELVRNDDKGKTSSAVITDPFPANYGSGFWAARTCSRVEDNRFMTEFINCTDNDLKVEAGYVVGCVEFIDEAEFNAAGRQTLMFCSYGGDIPVETEQGASHYPPPPPEQPQEEQPEASASTQKDDDIPEGAKRLVVDYSGVAKDAKSYIPRMKELFEKHTEAFSRHDRDYGKTTLIQYRAHMKDPDMTPQAQKPYRTRPEMRQAIDEQAHQMIADGLVGHSTSPWSAPILLAKKKCGGWRFLTDFRKVNDACDKVVYPLPRIEDSIQKLENPRFFSSMDLTKGFWQIPVHPKDRKYFAFSTESLHLEYLVAPMGAKNSPGYLSSLMQLVLRGLPIQHVISYLDDILVADTNMEEHLKHLDLVLSALAKAGLKLNPSKCAFARESVVCLGHKLSREGVSPDPTNIEKIKTWKAPTNVGKLRTFLGLTGYYRQFVRGYSDIASCLTDLTQNDVKWRWDKEHQDAFTKLRDILISDLIMAYPNFNLPFIVKTDASLTAIGYVLTQMVNDKEKVISYGSKKLSGPQRRWSTYDREFFALIAGVRANAHYLRHNSAL